MSTWTETHTAYFVAKYGTVSKAAEALGVHRATVNRHIDVLEEELGARLFIRHRRGYHLTEAGRDFLNVASRAHDILDDFAGRVRVLQSDPAGEIIVTTMFPISKIIMPAIHEFRSKHPNSQVSLLSNTALLKLELAEAHIALRVGAEPSNDDYVVQPFHVIQFALFASSKYVETRGMPSGLDDLKGHEFVGNPRRNSNAPFESWLAKAVPENSVVFRTGNPVILEDAVERGLGIGFLPVSDAEHCDNLHQIGPSLDEWTVRIWLVTHVDLHRTEKVQAMLTCLKDLEL